MDLIFDLCRHIVATEYDHLPAEVITSTKRFILDTLGVAIAGSSAPGCPAVADMVQDWGGKEESTVIVYGGKVPSLNAALANSMMSRALDFCDTHDDCLLHANTSVLWPALAIAEMRGGIGGKDLVAAVALGVDLMCRIALAVKDNPAGWSITTTAGAFGSTASAGKLLGLSQKQMVDAFGIVYSQAAGNVQCIIDGALSVRMQQAFAAKAGVLSALLAQRGITGAKNVLEGKFGFFSLYEGGRWQRKWLTEGLGEHYEGTNLSIKPYPCCRGNHGAIDATLSLVQTHGLRAEDIEEVIAYLPQGPCNTVGKPFQLRESPQVDVQFSIYYTLATAIVRGDVGVGDFAEEKIRDPYIHQVANKIRCLPHEGVEDPRALLPVTVEIKTKDGRKYTKRVDYAKGHPKNPMTDEECIAKFRKCSEYAARPLSGNNLNEVIDMVEHLDKVQDAGKLIELCTTKERR